MVIKAIYSFVAVNVEQPYRELFVWAVFCCRINLATMFLKECPDQVGSTLVASRIYNSLANKASSTKELQLANEMVSNARSFVTGEV